MTDTAPAETAQPNLFPDSVPEPDLPLIHTRDYQVKSYREGPDRLRIRGTVRDQKPPGVYIPDDPDPLTIHHMVVDLVVAFPTLEITAAEVLMEIHPNTTCPSIGAHYENLVGLSIARGFTHKVRELFGGPRGCTHTTALLQAMAPVAIQSVWSMRMQGQAEGGEPVAHPRMMSPEERMNAMAFNLNTCHVWAEDGPAFAEIRAGKEQEPPLWIQERFTRLGLDPMTWREMGSDEAGDDGGTDR